MTTFAIVFAFIIGTITGMGLIAFVQLWRVSQFAYGAGYRAGRYVAGVHVKRAQAFLDCDHFPSLPEGGPVCRSCAMRARVYLARAVATEPASETKSGE